MQTYMVEVQLRHTAEVPAGVDPDEWVMGHRDEILGSMRDRLDGGGLRIVRESDWGDLVDYRVE